MQNIKLKHYFKFKEHIHTQFLVRNIFSYCIAMHSNNINCYAMIMCNIQTRIYILFYFANLYACVVFLLN